MIQSGFYEDYDEYELNQDRVNLKNSQLFQLFIEMKKILFMINETEFTDIEKQYQICVSGLT